MTIRSSRDGIVMDLVSKVSILLKPCGEITLKVSETLEQKLCASCRNMDGKDLKVSVGKEAGNIAKVIDVWEETHCRKW